MVVFYRETRIIFIKPNMIGSVDNKSLIWFLVDNNSCSSCISHEITSMWSIIKILSCNTSIDDVGSCTTYCDVFVWSSCSIPEEVRNITTQYILILVGNPYDVLIGKATRLLLVVWVQYNRSCGISKFIIRSFTFTIERIFISTCSFSCDVHVVTCLHKFRIFC